MMMTRSVRSTNFVSKPKEITMKRLIAAALLTLFGAAVVVPSV